jgi:hypothetical protein
VLDLLASPLTFDRIQWAAFGIHLLVGSVFVAGAVSFLRTGELAGAALQSTMALLFITLGLFVAGIVGRRF